MNPYHGLQFPLGPLPINAAGQSGQRFNQLDKILLDENNVRRLWPHDHNGSTVMQPLPPTAQRIQERSSSSGGHSYDDDLGSDKGGTSNFRPDVGLSDEDLIIIETKDLNKILKKNNISKHRSQEIKQERRTLKNRGYASNCRVKREEEQDTLEEEIKKLKLEISRYNVPEMLTAIEFYEKEIKAIEKELKEELDDEELEAMQQREEYLRRQRAMNDSKDVRGITTAKGRMDDDEDNDEKRPMNQNPIKNEPDESIKVD